MAHAGGTGGGISCTKSSAPDFRTGSLWGRGRGGLMKLVLVSLNFGFYKIFRFRRDGEIKKN